MYLGKYFRKDTKYMYRIKLQIFSTIKNRGIFLDYNNLKFLKITKMY